MHANCEIEDTDFVETHICKVSMVLRSRVLLGVCPHQGYICRRLPLELQQRSLCQGQQGDANQSVRGKYNTRF